MTKTKRLELLGSPGSPYSRKMIGALRFRHIPFSVFWSEQQVPEGYPTPKIKLLPTFYFADGQDDALVPVTDSTPIIRRLEHDYEGRSVIPNNPVLRFLNDLIEDYADEWLTKAMFHYRWGHEPDARNAQSILVYYAMNTAPSSLVDEIGSKVARRQIDRLYVVGSNAVTAGAINESYERLVKILDQLLQIRGFVLGARPSSADFALFGQLTQLSGIEPSPAAITSRVSQRVKAWVDLMEDLSGLRPVEHDWFSVDTASKALRPLLIEIGRTYAPTMIANAKAVEAGEKSFETEVDGRLWTQPVFKYQAKCLGWLRQNYCELSPSDKDQVESILADTGCNELFNHGHDE